MHKSYGIVISDKGFILIRKSDLGSSGDHLLFPSRLEVCVERLSSDDKQADYS
jgi:hypothetical protein